MFHCDSSCVRKWLLMEEIVISTILPSFLSFPHNIYKGNAFVLISKNIELKFEIVYFSNIRIISYGRKKDRKRNLVMLAHLRIWRGSMCAWCKKQKQVFIPH